LGVRILAKIGWFVLMCGLTAAPAVLAGFLFAHFRGGVATKTAVAYALWISGAILIFLVGSSGSPSQMASESRAVVGGRFAPGSSIPMPRSSFVFIVVGAALIVIGTLVDLYI
jgi:hypothetical protein